MTLNRSRTVNYLLSCTALALTAAIAPASQLAAADKAPPAKPGVKATIQLGAGAVVNVKAPVNDSTDLLPGGQLTKHWHTKGNWSIDDAGVVSITPREGEKGWARFDAYLWSMKQYKDFEIEFDYMVEEKGNSGFYFHVGDKASPVAKGIEVQIYDSFPKGSDKKLTDHDSGGIIPGLPPARNAAKPAGEWNHFKITCQGNDVTVVLNGVIVNQLKLDNPKIKGRPETGYIGFQDHALPLKLRGIHIREL